MDMAARARGPAFETIAVELELGDDHLEGVDADSTKRAELEFVDDYLGWVDADSTVAAPTKNPQAPTMQDKGKSINGEAA